MLKRLRNAVSSVFEGPSSAVPQVPLAPPQPTAMQCTAVSSCALRTAPKLIACDAAKGLIALISDAHPVIVMRVQQHTTSTERCAVSVREDEKWIAAEFIPGTCWLLLLSDRLLLMIDIAEGSACAEDKTKVLYMRPSSVRATSLTVLCGHSVAAVGTSCGAVQFAKLAGFANTTTGNSGLQWCEFSADVYGYLQRELPRELNQEEDPSDCHPDTPTQASSAACSPDKLYSMIVRDGCYVRCCVQYHNDPNAFLAVLHRVKGVTKFYALENRISAFFSLPSDGSADAISSCAVTSGGGFVVALQRARVLVWNEQSAKRKDRTTPVHFVVDLPIAHVEPLPTLSCRLWLVSADAFDKKAASCCTGLFTLGSRSLCEFTIHCEEKALQSFLEHAVTQGQRTTCNAELDSSALETDVDGVFVCVPWVSNPWQGSWTRTDVRTWLCTNSTLGPGVIQLPVGSGLVTVSRIAYMQSTTRTTKRSAAHSQPLMLRVATESTLTGDGSICPSWVAAIRPAVQPSPDRLQIASQRHRQLTRVGNDVTFRVCGSRYAASSPQMTIHPLLDWATPYTSDEVLFHVNSAACACPLPTGWADRGTLAQNGCVLLPVGHPETLSALIVVLYTTAASTANDARLLVIAVFDPATGALTSCNEAPVQMLPREGPELVQPDIVEARLVDGHWAADATGKPSFRHREGFSVVVQLADGSFVFQNCNSGGATEAMPHLPSVLFPASDPITGFECFPMMPGHVDPNSSNVGGPHELMLLLVTQKGNCMVFNVSRCQVVGLRPLLPEGKAKSTITRPCRSVVALPSVEHASSANSGVGCIHAWNTALSQYEAVRLPRCFVVRCTISVVRGASANQSLEMNFLTGGGSTLLTIAVDLTLENSGVDCAATTATADADSNPNLQKAETSSSLTARLQYRVSAPCVGGAPAFVARQGLCTAPVPEDARELVVEFRYSLESDDSPAGEWSCSVVDEDGKAVQVEESIQDTQGTSATPFSISNQMICGLTLSVPPSADSVAALLCVEILSQPSDLLVASFVNQLPPRKAFNDDATIVVQHDDGTLMLYSLASVIDALGVRSSAAAKQQATLITPTACVALGSGNEVADWRVERLVLDGLKSRNVLTVLGWIATPLGKDSLTLYVVDLSTRLPVLPPVALPTPFDADRALSTAHVSLLRIYDEIHAYVFIGVGSGDGMSYEMVHVVCSELPPDEMSSAVGPRDTLWPTVRRFSEGAAAIASPSFSSNPSAQDLLRVLPPPPSSGSATQKEQGFFKRLIVSSLESQQQKLEAQLFTSVKEETYEDALERIIAPVERKLREEQQLRGGESDVERKRRELLGSQYAASQQRRGGGATSRGEMDRTRQQMNENLQLLHERGEKIDKVQTKSQLLADETAQFAELCKKLKEKERSRWF